MDRSRKFVKPPRGFDSLPYPQTALRDCLSRQRIPKLLQERGDYLSVEAANYIFDLEDQLLRLNYPLKE